VKHSKAVRVFTIGHSRRPVEELVTMLQAAGAQTLVDVRRFPGSRRNPQFNKEALAAALEAAGLAYRHAVALGGRLSGEPGEERFGCITTPAFRSYAARMGTEPWQQALAAALGEPEPCFMCAETPWWRCHRRWIAELLHVRGYDVLHLLEPHVFHRHKPFDEADARDGKLYICGELVA
jgi:uncharacterized protein (DUF488 family)